MQYSKIIRTKDDELIAYLKSKPNINNYILDLIKVDMNRNKKAIFDFEQSLIKQIVNTIDNKTKDLLKSSELNQVIFYNNVFVKLYPYLAYSRYIEIISFVRCKHE